MARAPLFSRELRTLRGTISVSQMADICKVSREAIRRIESGGLLPSNSVLRTWLDAAGTSLSDRPDIIRSVIAERVSRNTYVKETEELRHALCAADSSYADTLATNIVDTLEEAGIITDDSRDWIHMKVRRIIEHSQ